MRPAPLGLLLAALASVAGGWWLAGSGAAAEPPGTADGVVLAPTRAPAGLAGPASAPPPAAPRAPFSAEGLRRQASATEQAEARVERARHTLASYREATRYPHESRPIAEHPDQVRPFAPIPGELPLRLPGGRSAAGVRLLTTQERVFASGAETVRFTVSAVNEQGRTLPLLISRAIAFDLPDPRQAAGRPASPVAFVDDGQGPDTQAGDGVWSGVFSPATQGFADYAGTLRVQLDLNQDGQRGQLGFDVVYQPLVPGEWGAVSDTLREGSLAFVLALTVHEPGRYVVSGRVDDARGQPFALVSFNEELGRGPQQVLLQVFGKLLRDGTPALPLTLRDVEGFLLWPDRFPDRAMLARRPGAVHTSKRYALERFSTAEWQGEERQRYLDELQRDLARAEAALPPPPASAARP